MRRRCHQIADRIGPHSVRWSVMRLSARLLRLLPRCSSGRPYWTGPELADRLGVTDRTVRRDVERLRDLGYPVDAAPEARPAATGWAPAPRCRRCCSTTTRRSPSPSGCARGRRRGRRASRRPRCAALAKLEQVLPARLRRRVDALRRHRAAAGAGAGPRSTPRRSTCSPRRAATASASASPTAATTATATARDGRAATGWCTRAGAGTWSPGTSTATTGARSGSTGSTTRDRPGPRRPGTRPTPPPSWRGGDHRALPPPCRPQGPGPGRRGRRADTTDGRHRRGGRPGRVVCSPPVRTRCPSSPRSWRCSATTSPYGSRLS